MASPFDDLDAAISGAIKDVFSEAAAHTPRVSSQYVARVDDPNQSVQVFHGVFSSGPAEEQIKGRSRGSEFSGTTRLASANAEFWVAKSEVDALAALPAKGDKISLTDRAGSPVYAISNIQHTDMGDINLILVWEDQST